MVVDQFVVADTVATGGGLAAADYPVAAVDSHTAAVDYPVVGVVVAVVVHKGAVVDVVVVVCWLDTHSAVPVLAANICQFARI